jgi:hypothetical protein
VGRGLERGEGRILEFFSEKTAGLEEADMSVSIFRKAMYMENEPLRSSFSKTAVAAEYARSGNAVIRE